MIKVRDGSRELQFEGEVIGHSTSRRQGQQRWVEFDLFRTVSGIYVLSRVGRSVLFHRAECQVVSRNNLKEAPSATLELAAEACYECRPDPDGSVTIYPERPRYWAQVCDDPQAVVDALYKEDSSGNLYLTQVARRLLETAGKLDTEIAQAYRVEKVP